MGFLDRRRRDELKELEAFARSREGVEGFLEPQTQTYQSTLLVVDRNGQWVRAEIPDRKKAETICKTLGIPLYDAALVGYPARLKRKKQRADVPTNEELEAWFAAEADQAEDR